MKKKAGRTQKRAKKARIKDREPKSDPKGGLNFATDTAPASAALVFLKYGEKLKVD